MPASELDIAYPPTGQVELTVEAECMQQAEHVARAAKQRCLIGHALEVPIELELVVQALDLPRPAVAV